MALLMRNRLVFRFTNDAQIKVVDFLIAQYRGKKIGKKETGLPIDK